MNTTQHNTKANTNIGKVLDILSDVADKINTLLLCQAAVTFAVLLLFACGTFLNIAFFIDGIQYAVIGAMLSFLSMLPFVVAGIKTFISDIPGGWTMDVLFAFQEACWLTGDNFMEHPATIERWEQFFLCAIRVITPNDSYDKKEKKEVLKACKKALRHIKRKRVSIDMLNG